MLCVTNKPIMLSAVILSVIAEESMVDGNIEKWPDRKADRHIWANKQMDGHIDKWSDKQAFRQTDE